MDIEMTDRIEPFQEERGEAECSGIDDLLSVPDMEEYNQRLFQDDPLGSEPTVRGRIEQATRDKLLALNLTSRKV